MSLNARATIRLLAFFALCTGAPLHGQAAPSDSARAALQRRMMRWVMPGDEHKALERLGGSWDVTVALPGAPGRAPTIMTGRATARMAVGDRFLVIESLARGGSQSIEGLTVLGFDGRKEEFTYVGHDSFGTYYVTAAGRGDLRTGRLELAGTDRESATSSKHFTVRVAVRDPDFFSLAIAFRSPAGDEFTVMETEFRRASASPASDHQLPENARSAVP